jgi:hypothetical protein
MSNFDLRKYLAEGRLLKEEINFGEYKDTIDFEDLKRFKTQEEWDLFIKYFDSTIEGYRDINEKVPSTVLDYFFKVSNQRDRLDKDQTNATEKGEYSDWWAKADKELGFDLDDDIYSYVYSWDEPWENEFAKAVTNIEADNYEDFKSQVKKLYDELNPF